MDTDAHNNSLALTGAESGDGASRDLALLTEEEAEFSSLEGLPEASGFSPLDLGDRVVISLLFNEVARIEQVERAWVRWKALPDGGAHTQLWRVLAEDPELGREPVFAAAAEAFAFKPTRVTKNSALGCLRRVREEFTPKQWERMQALQLLPVQGPPQRWVFVTHDPLRTEVHSFLKSLKFPQTDLEYAPESFTTALTAETELLRNEYLERVHNSNDSPFEIVRDAEEKLIDDEALEAEISQSALINLFEAMLVEAVRRGASDIHVFPNPEDRIGIHFRVDGELDCWYTEESARPEAFLAVVKDRSHNVDRFERDRGQDGFIQRKVDGALIRFRVSVLPISHVSQQARYESVVIRVLDDRKVLADLADLGLSEEDQARFAEAIHQPTGMVILTGPTGSGKSTTLYAALHQIRSPKRNVLTAEDPVEYVIPGVRQLRLGHKLGVEEALRFILRHDPDVVMVGEMRDRVTAELAVQLANTGHLTFSTLHTNDAPSAVSRLYKMGIEPFLVAHSINLVVAQRLVRVLCPDCKVEVTPDAEILERLGFTASDLKEATLYTAGPKSACKTCSGHGYRGRRAITEMLPVTPAIQRIIVTSEAVLDEDAIRGQAIKDGMRTLHDAARSLVLQGETSVEEVLRSVGVNTR